MIGLEYLKILLVGTIFLGIQVQCYKPGDLVRMSKRSLIKMTNSEWTEVIAKNCPRFTYDKKIVLQLADSNANSKEPLKIARDLRLAFSFDHERLITPYFTIINSGGTFLESLELTFVYSGDDIVELNWKNHYSDDEGHDHVGTHPTTLTINFLWQEFDEIDSSMGMSVFLFTGFSMGLFMLIYVILDSEAKNVGAPPDETSESEKSKENQKEGVVNPKSKSSKTMKRTIGGIGDRMQAESTIIEPIPEIPFLKIPEDELEEFVGASDQVKKD